MGGKILKRGTRGTASKFIGRTRCLRRLQLSLPEFQRLCILKGVHPQIPSSKVKDKSQVYYHVKDIAFLRKEEKLLERFRGEKVSERRIKRAVGRRDSSSAREIIKRQESEPLVLDKIIKERYPTLVDALKDLDDCLSTLALYAVLPADTNKDIGGKDVQEAARALNTLQLFLTQTGSIRKAFISIKGFYIQANVLGVKIHWLIPHAFTHSLPTGVDYRVLKTFLTLYLQLAKFLSYKLYKIHNLQLPQCPTDPLGNGILGINVAKSEEETVQPKLASDDDAGVKTLFRSCVVYISREVPLNVVGLIVRSGGGKVGWPGTNSPIKEEDASITHHLVDRPVEHVAKIEKEGKLLPREYIQPQWVFDSLNNGVLLPMGPYRPGVALPPHLSPFVNDTDVGYVPVQRERLDQIVAEIGGQTPKAPDSDGESVASEAESDDESDVEEATQLHEQSLLTNKPPPKTDKSTKQKKKQAEEIDQRKALLTKKHKRLLEKIEFGHERKKVLADKLVAKRKALEKKPKSK